MFDDLRRLDAAAALAPPRVEANMRRLRALLEVARCRSVNRAAERLHLTQSAVTRSIRALEQELGLALFERSSRGMTTTDYGDIVVRRARRAFDYLEAAEGEVAVLPAEGARRRPLRGLVHKVAQRHLLMLSAVAEHLTETAAAQHLGISQPAVTIALRDLEQMVGRPLFVRAPRGMTPTPAGELLIRGAKLALSEIAAAGADLAARLGLVGGRLVVGVLPLSGAQIAPLVAGRVAAEHAQLSISVVEGSYDVLIKGLRCGDVDVIVGWLPPHPPPDVTQERLFDDGLVVVVRHGHPLTQRSRLTLDDLAGAEWVVPYRRTAHRNMIERAMLQAGLCVPAHSIEANSVTLVCNLLLDSDRLSVLSRRHIHADERKRILAALPIDLPTDSMPVGFTTRSDAMRTVGLETLIAQLRSLPARPDS